MNKPPLSEKDSLALTEFSSRISRLLGHNLKRLALFGSKAEGRSTPESDIDVLVLIKKSSLRIRNQIFDEAFEVNVKHGVYISPRIISLSVYNHPVWRVTPFLKGLRATAVPL